MEHGLQRTSLHMQHCNCCYGKQEVHQLVHKEMTNNICLQPYILVVIMVNTNLTLMMVTKWSTTVVQRQRITNTSTHLRVHQGKHDIMAKCVTNFSHTTFTSLTFNLMMANQFWANYGSMLNTEMTEIYS